jgi:site-specific DNA-methyltransferase (adenine-specific)
MIDLRLGDCLIESDKIESGSVDLILTDLPYGTMKGINEEFVGYGRKNHDGHLWDNVIDTNKIMKIADRILRKDGKVVLFAQDPFSTELKNSQIQNIPYNYSMIWEKNDFANALLSKKAPVNYYEDILVFSKDYEKGKDIKPTNPIYDYLKKCKIESGITTTEFNYKYCEYSGKLKNKHRSLVARYWETSQFLVPTKEIYENVLQPTGYFKIPYNEMIKMNTYKGSTFNLWEGKKYKSNILKYKKDYDGHHPTQKPVLLLEDLIKTFSNENDLVVDLTMGSGSTGVAAKNLNRNFIGIEQDQKYFNIAEQRIKETEFKLF